MAAAGVSDFFVLDNTTFPTRPACFGNDPTNSSCVLPSQSMIDFLNITNPSIYLQAYCLEPPNDSCAFGYCPNPDIASPAVRIATYVGTVCLAILLLYQPRPSMDSFYGLILQNYSLMIAAIISLVMKQLTRLHAVFALLVAGSPLSVYLLAHATRSVFTRCNSRLEGIFGKSVGYPRFINRAVVFAAVPFWVTVFAIIMQSPNQGWFSQTACDEAALRQPNEDFSDGFHDGTVAIFVGAGIVYFLIIQLPLGSIVFVWLVIAWFRKRKEIRNRPKGVNYFSRAWRVITGTYPFMRFAIIILLPFSNWVLVLELGSDYSNEQFTPTLGQILVVSAAVPPFMQCMTLLPRLMWWFIDLTWVRFLTCRSNAPYHNTPTDDDLGSYHKIQEASFVGGFNKPFDGPEISRPSKPLRNDSENSTMSTLSSGSTVVDHKSYYGDGGFNATMPISLTFPTHQESVSTTTYGYSRNGSSRTVEQSGKTGIYAPSWKDPFSSDSDDRSMDARANETDTYQGTREVALPHSLPVPLAISSSQSARNGHSSSQAFEMRQPTFTRWPDANNGGIDERSLNRY